MQLCRHLGVELLTPICRLATPLAVLFILVSFGVWLLISILSTSKNTNPNFNHILALLSESRDGNPGSHAIQFDGHVRDCITREVRDVGVRREGVMTSRLTVPPQGRSEDRKKSMASFVKVFQQRAWEFNSGSVSGIGSTIQFAQEESAGLHSVINELKLLFGVNRISLLDLPCGDMLWMQRFLETRDDIDYTGIDIVPDLINSHRKHFSRTLWKFLVHDVIKDGLPSGTYHLIHCRHMLQHLLNTDVLKLLSKFSSLADGSSSIYLLATSHINIANNSDLTGQLDGGIRYRPLNLEAPPISLAPPICYFRDGPPSNSELIWTALWRLPLLQVVGCTQTKMMKIKMSLHLVGQNHSYFSCGDWSI